jgi:hypothetical protein
LAIFSKDPGNFSKFSKNLKNSQKYNFFSAAGWPNSATSSHNTKKLPKNLKNILEIDIFVNILNIPKIS